MGFPALPQPSLPLQKLVLELPENSLSRPMRMILILAEMQLKEESFWFCYRIKRALTNLCSSQGY